VDQHGPATSGYYRLSPFSQRFFAATFLRKVRADGSVLIHKAPYYVSRTLRGLYVTPKVNAIQRVFEVTQQGQSIKQLPIQGLRGGLMPYLDFLELMGTPARSDYRLAGHSRG
jgi:hypothetical protein